MSKYEPETVNIKKLRRESEARASASITRLGITKDDVRVDPYDNTPSFMKNKETRFKLQQSGYTNTLLEKILESQTNKDAWAATQQYQKKSLEHLEKISSKLTQLVPDKKEEQKEFEKTKARCSAITRAILSGNGQDVGKMIWQGIKEAETPMGLSMIMDTYPMIQMALEMGGTAGVIKMVGDQLSEVILEHLPKTISHHLKEIKNDLPGTIDSQFIQMYNSLYKFNEKTRGNRASSDALQIMKAMGISGDVGSSLDNLQSKSKNYKERMSFDRAFYETVTNGIPQQLARIEQAIRGGYVFHWDAKTGKFKRMDKSAFNDVVTPNNLRSKMHKDAGRAFMDQIVENDDVRIVSANAGIRIKRNNKGEKEIDSEVVTAVLGFKWHDFLSRDNAIAMVKSINSSTTPQDIRRMVSSVVDVRSWNGGAGYNPFAEFKRADVDEADKIVGGYILRLLMGMRNNVSLKEIVLEQIRDTQQRINDEAERLSYQDGFTIDLEATIQSGATNMTSGIQSRGAGGKAPKPKHSANKTVRSTYGYNDDDAKKKENKVYSITQLTRAITELTVESDHFGYGNDAGDKIAATYAIKKKLVALQKNKAAWDNFVNSCINPTNGNLDSKRFNHALTELLTGDNAKELERLRQRMLKTNGGKQRYGKYDTAARRKLLNEDIASSFYSTVNNQIGNIGNIEDLSTAGASLLTSILEEEQTSLKQMGITTAVVAKISKDFLKTHNIVTNPIAGTILGSMLGAGSVFVQHTKYFKTLMGQDPDAFNSDGNMTNQDRVLADLLTNKVGPMLAGLGLGKSVNKVFKKMGPIGKIIGIPAAIITGVATFGATSMAKSVFGDAIVGEKDKNGGRRGKNWFTRVVRDVGHMLPGVNRLLDNMDAEANEAEKQGMTRKEWRKAKKNGEALYRDGDRSIKVDKDGKFTITGSIPDGKDKDGNDKTISKSASGTLRTKNLKDLEGALVSANIRTNNALKNLTPEEREEISRTGLADISKDLKSEDDIESAKEKLRTKLSGTKFEFVSALLDTKQAELRLQKAVTNEAEQSFDATINNSDLKTLSAEDKASLKADYVSRAVSQYKEHTLHNVLFKGEERPETAAGKIWQNIKGTAKAGKLALWTAMSNSSLETIREFGNDKIQSMDEASDAKTLTKLAGSWSHGLDNLFDYETGKINPNAIQPEFTDEEWSELSATDNAETSKMNEAEWRTRTYDAQYDMAVSLQQISNQIGRLFYESLPVYEREPSMDDVMRGGSDPTDDSEFSKFKKIAGSHIGYKSGSGGKNKFTKDGRAYCTTGSRQATIQALGKEDANRVFAGTGNMGDPKKIMKAYKNAGIWRTRKHAPTEGSEAFFKRGKGQYHGAIIKSINGDEVIVQNYNDANGGVSEERLSLKDMMADGSDYIGHGALNWDQPVSDIAPDLEPGTTAGPGDESPQTPIVVQPDSGMGDYGQQIVDKLTMMLSSGIPVNVVNDISSLGDIQNSAKFRDTHSSMKRSIAAIKDPATRQLMENALNQYRVLRSKDGVKKENEQDEENEELQTSAFKKIINWGADKLGLGAGEAAGAAAGGEAAAAAGAAAGGGAGGLGSLMGLIGGAGGAAGLGAALTHILPVVGGVAATVIGIGGAITGLIGLYKLADKFGLIEFLGKAKDKISDLLPWNWFKDTSEGSEIDDEGNVTEYGKSGSINDGLQHLNDAVNIVKGLTKTAKGIVKGSFAGAKKLVGAVGKTLLHPIDTIKKLANGVKDVKNAAGNVLANFKRFAGTIAGVLSKICEYLSGSFITKIPWLGKHLKNLLTKLQSCLGKFSSAILEKLGPLFQKAGQQATKEAGKKGILKKIPIMNLALIGFSAADGYRHAADYLGMMPANLKDKDNKKVVKPGRGLKLKVGFFRAVYDNLISMAGSYFGSALAAVTLGGGSLATVAISVVATTLEVLWHAAEPFEKFLERLIPYITDAEELREARLNNKAVAEDANTPDGENALVAELQAEGEEVIEGLDPEENAGGSEGSEPEGQGRTVATNVSNYKTATVSNANASANTSTPWYSKLGSVALGAIKGGAAGASSAAMRLLLGNDFFDSKYSKNLKSYSGSDYQGAVSALIQNAESQIGYTEYGNNGNMYAGEVGAQNYQPWCSTFQDYLFTKTFGKDTAAALLGGSSSQPSTWGRAQKMMNIDGGYVKNDGSVDPQPGDLAFFDFKGEKRHSNPTNHIALVTSVDSQNGIVETIEGNTQPEEKTGSQSNGGMVARRRRHYKGKTSIVSFGRPDWSKIGDTSVAALNSNDGKLKPGEAAGGIFETLGNINRGIDTVYKGTRTVANAKRSAEAIKRTMDYTKKANEGKSFWEKARNNTRAAANIVGSVGRVAGDIGYTLGNNKLGNTMMDVANTANVVDRYARVASHQMDMVGSVITNVQTKTAGGIIDAVQTSGHILSSGFGGLIQGMDVNTRKLDQVCNTGDRTLRVLEEIKGILGRGNFLTQNSLVASVS